MTSMIDVTLRADAASSRSGSRSAGNQAAPSDGSFDDVVAGMISEGRDGEHDVHPSAGADRPSRHRRDGKDSHHGHDGVDGSVAAAWLGSGQAVTAPPAHANGMGEDAKVGRGADKAAGDDALRQVRAEAGGAHASATKTWIGGGIDDSSWRAGDVYADGAATARSRGDADRATPRMGAALPAAAGLATAAPADAPVVADAKSATVGRLAAHAGTASVDTASMDPASVDTARPEATVPAVTRPGVGATAAGAAPAPDGHAIVTGQAGVRAGDSTSAAARGTSADAGAGETARTTSSVATATSSADWASVLSSAISSTTATHHSAPTTVPAPVPAGTPLQPALSGSLLDLRGAADGTYQLRLSVHPAELGAVSVTATVHQGALTVLLSPDPTAQQAISQALPQLRQQLIDAGFAGVDVSVGTPGHHGGQSEESHRHGSRGSDESAAIDPTTTRPQRATRGPRSLLTLDRWL